MLDYIIYGLMLFYYSLFFIAAFTCYKNKDGQLKDILSGKGEPGILFTRLIAGIFFLGIGTTCLIVKRNPDPEIFTLAWENYQPSFWIFITAAAAMITGISSAFKKISATNNSSHSLPLYLPLSYVLVRTLFLIVYEFFFRGVMLFVMVEDFGMAAAIIINIILYVLIHWPDKEERYGSMLMGIILCSISLYYHSVWPAIAIHLALSLGHEITLLINNRSFIKKSWL